MKLTLIFLTVFFVNVTAETHSQSITFSGNEVPLESVFVSVKKQTGFVFLYSSTAINSSRPVSISASQMPLQDFLRELFKNQPLNYSIDGKSILVSPKPVSNGNPKKTIEEDNLAPLINIHGIVADPEGILLSGANIFINANKHAGVTDADGKFNLQARQGDVLVFSFISYEKLELKLFSERTAIVLSSNRRAALAEDEIKYSRMVRGNAVPYTQNMGFMITLSKVMSQLDEVQVMAYGKTTRRLGTGTISSVTMDDIEKQSSGNLMEAIGGKMAGVQVIQNNGMPGSGFAVKVRGDNTLGMNFGFSSSDPLYVIDGIPQVSGYSSYDNRRNVVVYGMNGAPNLLSNINPKDILQVDVLKDADATAIYGARGANGVVLITTKKGQPGKIRFNADISESIGKIAHFIPMLSTPQYLALRKEAFINEGITPDAGNAPDLVNWDPKADNDFQRLIFGGKARTSNASINISGGNDNVKYYAGLNYRNEGTVMPGDQFVKRIGGLINFEVTSLDRKFNAFITGSYSGEQSNISSASFATFLFAPPNYEPLNADGTYNWNVNFNNPMALLLKKYHSLSTLFNSSLTLSYKPFSGLTLKVLSTYSLNRIDNDIQVPAASQNPFYSPPSGSAIFALSPTSSYTVEPQATYTFHINKSQITALAGGTVSAALSESTILYGDNYAYESQLNTIAAAGNVYTSYLFNQYKYASGFARLSYDLKHKYLVNLNYRKDASSRFASNNKLAGFASVGAAWVFSSEKAISEKLPFLSFGKIKISYGSTGNDRVDNYLYAMYYGMQYSSSGVYQGIPALDPISEGNPQLGWEITRKAELSLDLGFLEDRILLRGNIYRNRSSNIINAQVLPSQAGTSYITGNVDALVQNRGIEIELATKNIQKRDLSWSTGFNISFEKNELVRFNNIENTDAYGRYFIGAPIDAFLNYYKYQYDGPDPVTGVPTYKNLDENPGPDKYIMRQGVPFYGGLTNTVSYRNFALDLFVKFDSHRGKINDLVVPQALGSMQNQNTTTLNRFTPGKENRNVIWPAAVTGLGNLSNSYNNFYRSDFGYGNAGYVKLKSVNLSYEIPDQWLGRGTFQSLKLYIQGQDLLTFSDKKYVMDPEVSSGLYPCLRTFTFGIICKP